MAAVPRIDPKTIFTPDEWRRLTARSDLLGLSMVAHAWGLIALAMLAFHLAPNPITWALAVMVVGARQLGLAILMHEAAHNGLSRNAQVNEWVGQWLCAAPVGTNLAAYRPYHFAHHKHTQTPQDPDLGLSAPFPISKAAFRRKMIRDLTGQTFFKLTVLPLLRGFAPSVVKGARAPKGLARQAAPFLLTNAVLLAALALMGVWHLYVLIWLAALATWFPFVTRVRNIAEHACTPVSGDPFGQARTTRGAWFERLLIAPYWVNFHAEHHLWPYLPAYRLEETHRLLMAKGYRPRMAVEARYADVLRLATSANPA